MITARLLVIAGSPARLERPRRPPPPTTRPPLPPSPRHLQAWRERSRGSGRQHRGGNRHCQVLSRRRQGQHRWVGAFSSGSLLLAPTPLASSWPSLCLLKAPVPLPPALLRSTGDNPPGFGAGHLTALAGRYAVTYRLVNSVYAMVVAPPTANVFLCMQVCALHACAAQACWPWHLEAPAAATAVWAF